ncbi:MAG: 4Fe-4S binding protein [Nitrospirae bacterium]|nr:4Fe-4S binding protein [Nitrospirota bacterium]
MRIDRIRPFRRLAGVLQATVIAGLPFVRIKGESALRFDVPSLKLYFFGAAIWMQEFFIVLAAVLFLLFLLMLVTLTFGRIWCGWICPQTVLTDLTGFLERWKLKGMPLNLISLLFMSVISAFVSATLIWYFVSPYEFFEKIRDLHPGPAITWSWGILSAVIFADLAFVRQRFCATACPYSKMQSTLFDGSTMVIAFDQRRQDECMNCSACVRVCPVKIDVRKGQDPACITCAACIDKCRDMKEISGGRGLIGYFFGRPGQENPIMRKSVLLMSAATLSLLFFFIYLSLNRTPVDLTVFPASDIPARVSPDGRTINAYSVFVENRSGKDLELSLSMSSETPRGLFRLNPDTISMAAGAHKKLTIFAVGEDTGAHPDGRDVSFTAAFGPSPEDRVIINVPFKIPGGP